MNVFAPEPFADPAVNPETATLFRRAPYISPSEYKQTPTAVGVANLVPKGDAAEQLAALAAVISRASGWLDTICFHSADGTLAASPSTETAWVPVNNGMLNFICNYKPILAVNAMDIGPGPTDMQSIGAAAAKTLTWKGKVISLPFGGGSFGIMSSFPSVPLWNGQAWTAVTYVNGYPHSALAETAAQGAEQITVQPSQPGGTEMFGVYPGTQLTIHDGGKTEIVVVKEVESLVLKLQSGLMYEHTPPEYPDSTRVTAIPWDVEQACISLVSCLIKMRGSRAMILPSSPGGNSGPAKQAMTESGGLKDFETAVGILKPYTTVFRRST